MAMVSRHPTLCLFRAFSTATPHSSAGSSKQALQKIHASIPPYPYPQKYWYKQSNFGLYGNARIQFGNTVSEITETKNRRRWHPNVRHKRLWSVALNRFVRVKVLARVLRTIDKVGGLDEYLLGEKPGRIKDLGMGGWALRWRLMRTDAVKERYRLQRIALGLGDSSEQVAVTGSGREILDEKVLAEQEKAFDRQLDEDDKRAEKGKDGGLEIGLDHEFVEEKIERGGKTKEKLTT